MAVFTSELSGSLIFKSGSTLQASLVPKVGSLALTGSFNITGSQLTFNGTDVIGRIVNLEAGSVGSSSLGPLNAHSASINAYTASSIVDSASFDSRIDNLSTNVSSNDTDIAALQALTSSYYNSTGDLTSLGFLTSSNSNIVSSSTQIENYGFVTSSVAEIPAGTVSSSQQILDLGFVTSSNTVSASHALTANTASYILATNIDGTVATATTSATASYILASNIDGLIDSSSHALTASYIDPAFISASAAAAGFGVSNIPAGTISSSQQISDLGFITSSSEVDLIALGVIHAYTASTDPRLDALEAATSSYATGSHTSIIALNTFTSSYYTDSSSFDSRINNVSVDTSSLDSRLTSLEAATSSYATGSHTSIVALNAFTSSYSIDSASFDQRILNITSSAADTTGLLTTASYQIDSASFDSRISSINASGDTSFDGNKVVSNTLLGDLYSSSFNAGTTGSIQEFLTAMFFPTAAPTATFTDQSAIFNTNQATSGSNLVSVAITDTVDDSPYTLILTGAGANSLNAVPTNAASSSWEIRAKNDLSASTYTYTVTVGDSTSATREYSNRTITIAQATSGSFTTSGNFYIIESATNGAITNTTSGIPGTAGYVSVSYSPNYGSQVATNFSSSNSLISVNSTTGYLTVNASNPISGSGNLAGSTLHSNISFNDQYGNANTGSISISVTANSAPTITETNNTGNLNTNLAVSGALVNTISFNDPEGDAINYDSFNFVDNSGKLVATRDNTVFRVRPNVDLTAGTYAFTSSIQDEHGFRRTTATHTFTIAQADNGSLTGDTNIYIIESALSGSVYRDATGYNNGNPAQVAVVYSPNYGSQTATFTSSNAAIVINNSGYLTLGVDLSGSLTQSGDTIASTITWNDQYGNTDSSLVLATVFANLSPSATFTDGALNTDTATSGSAAGTLSITDTESNSPFRVSIAGTSGSLFNPVSQNAASSSWQIQPTGSLLAGSYPITATIIDSYDKQATVNGTITVSQAATDTLYVYDVGFYDSTYNNNLGITSQDSNVPPVATSYTGFGFLEKIEDGDLGSTSFTYSWGSTRTATLLASASGTNVNTILTNLSTISKTNSNRFVIIMPSGSSMSGVPRTMNNSYGGSTLDQYVLEVGADGTAIGSGLGTTETSVIHKIGLGSAVNGVSDYIMVGPANAIASSTSIELRIIAESGSAT